MKEEKLTNLEEKILNEIIRPSISSIYKSRLHGVLTAAEDLNFVLLLDNIKRFYEGHDGRNWDEILIQLKSYSAGKGIPYEGYRQTKN